MSGKQAQQAEAIMPCLQIVCFTQPLEPSLWKTLLKLLNNSMFPAKAALIAALARCEADTWQPRGLVQGGLSALQPYLHSVIGQPQSSKAHRCVLLALQCLIIFVQISHLRTSILVDYSCIAYIMPRQHAQHPPAHMCLIPAHVSRWRSRPMLACRDAISCTVEFRR